MPTVEEIIIKYTTDLDELKKDMKSIQSQMDKTDKNASNAGKNISGSFKKAGAAIGAAFAIRQVVSFGLEITALAAKAEGVKRAFSTSFTTEQLDKLRDSVQGTVSDLELMRHAVRAKNFKIPLDTLEKGFAFATKRASETGEAVDSLVTSFVDGMGGKSVQQMAKLGISTSELQAEIQKTGDFTTAASNIIAREMSNAGDVVLTTEQRQTKLNASFENLKVLWGEALLPLANTMVDIFTDLTLATIDMSDAMGTIVDSERVGFWQKLGAVLSYLNPATAGLSAQMIGLSTAIKAADADAVKYEDNLDLLFGHIETYAKDHVPKLRSEFALLNDELKRAKELTASYVIDQRSLKEESEEMQALSKEMDAADKMRSDKAQEEDSFWTVMANDLQEVNDKAKLLQETTENEEFLEANAEKVAKQTARLEELKNSYLVLGDVIGGFGTIFGAVGDIMGLEGEKAAKFQKAAALFGIAADTARAISSAVAAANENPLNGVTFGAAGIAQLVTTLASIAVNIAKAKSVLGGQQEPKYAKGVIGLQGPGTGTSDSIPARLSHNESVMTSAETNKWGDLLWAIRRNKVDEWVANRYDDALLRQTVKFGYKKADKNTNRLIKAISKRQMNVGW